MKRKLATIIVFASVLLLVPATAEATCQPGYIGKENGKLVVRLPQCHPFPE